MRTLGRDEIVGVQWTLTWKDGDIHIRVNLTRCCEQDWCASGSCLILGPQDLVNVLNSQKMGICLPSEGLQWNWSDNRVILF